MANRLKMALAHSILTLHECGWSLRRIARELHIDRATVRRYILSSSNPATKAPPGSGGESVLPAEVPAGWACGTDPPAQANTGTPSACEPYRSLIQPMVDQGLSAVRIHRDLCLDHRVDVSYYSVRRFVRKLDGSALALPMRRMECQPGQEAQVDFGTGAPVVDAAGKRRRCYVFRITLSCSRSSYSESVFRQTTDTFMQCLENAFVHFGGVPKTLVIDNLKAAVSRADWYDPDLNPRLQAFCRHYGTVLMPTKPYTPRHKGKIERGIGYVQDNALKGKQFSSLAEQNTYLLWWETQVADTRIHGTTRQQVGKVFAESEKPALLPLPAERFAFFLEAQRSVHLDG